MESIGDIMRQSEPNKKHLNKLLKQAQKDAQKDKYTHAFQVKAEKLTNKETIVK